MPYHPDHCHRLLLSATLLCVLGACDRGRPVAASAAEPPVQQGYIGVDTCSVCHGPFLAPAHSASYLDDWLGSAHGRARNVVPSEASIIGDHDSNGQSDFRDGLDLGSQTAWHDYSVAGGAIGELAPHLSFSAATGYVVTLGARTFTVDRVLGSGRHQQTFLTRLGASHYVLPLAYRVATKSWEPLLPEQWYLWDDANGNGLREPGESILGLRYASAADTPVTAGRTTDAFERACAGCHVTGLTDLRRTNDGEFVAAWQEDGVGCEACHGPAGLHARTLGGRGTPGRLIADPTDFDATAYQDLCSSCHSRGRSKGAVGGTALAFPWRADGAPFVPGQALADAFTVDDAVVDRVHGLQGNELHRGSPGSAHGTWSHTCRDCHQAHGTRNLALVRETVRTPTSGDRPVVFTARSGPPGSGGLLGDATDSTFTDVCEVCHTQTDHFRNDASTPLTGHFDGQNCTECHRHENGFQRPDSNGGQDCSGCHQDLVVAMQQGPAYRHTLLDSQPVHPDSAAELRCLSCHVDHDLFHPDTGAGRGANLRRDIATVPNNANDATNRDFLATGTGGICLSCHRVILQKGAVRPDGSTATPAIPFAGTAAQQVAAYQASAHGSYQVASTFRPGGIDTFFADCSKCHDDDTASRVGAQTGTHQFGVHATSHSRMTASLGSATEPVEERFCYRCHARAVDPVGGTGKAVAGRDWYDAAPMSARAEGIFALANKPFRHDVAASTGLHHVIEGAAAGWNPAGARHVECADCHNPHAAAPSRAFDTSGTFAQPLTTGNLTSGTPLAGVFGVDVVWPGPWATPDATAYARVGNSQFSWQVCLKCHSGYAYLGTPPAGSTDQAREFNPANASYHAVIGPSRTTFPPNSSFVAPWTKTSAMACHDCHTTDGKNEPQGPHGSVHRGMLAGRFDQTTGQTGTGNHLCFKCHTFAVYGRGGSGGAATTGFSGSGDNLHTFHAGRDYPGLGRRVTCSDCHAALPHGWHRRALLVVTGDPAPYASPAAALSPQDIPSWPASGNWHESNCSSTACHND